MPKQKIGIYIEMTGSPRNHGFKTKQAFLNALQPFDVHYSKLEHGADYLITDDLLSDSIKMQRARRFGAKIRTYSQFVNEFKEIARVKKLQEIMSKIKNNQSS